MTTPQTTPRYITRFTGEHGFLSNFYEAPFQLAGGDTPPTHWWNTAEHAFQAYKATDLFGFTKIRNARTPAEAKRLGRKIECRPDWDLVKRELMLRILLSKFSIPDLHRQLIATGDAILVEGNTWNDVYWGAVPAPLTVSFRRGPGFPPGELPVWRPGGMASEWLIGCNWLGRLLMMCREVITP